MSNRQEREAEDSYEAENDRSPVSGTVHDSSYATGASDELTSQIPVQGDKEGVEDPIDTWSSNTDKQLGKELDFKHGQHIGDRA